LKDDRPAGPARSATLLEAGEVPPYDAEAT